MIKQLAKKRFVAFARVSSREQQREGFSLDVQEDALFQYAERNNGEIVEFRRVAETASNQAARKEFTALIDWTIQNAPRIDAILFYKVDRAIRNTADLWRLEDLEFQHKVLVEFISQPFPHTPAGWMQVRNLANMATYQTQQQSIDVKEGQERRVRQKKFPQTPPYGYETYRKDGRSLVRTNQERAANVRRIFELYAFYGETLDSIVERMYRESRFYKPEKPRFERTKIQVILNDPSYLGWIKYKGKLWEGEHERLVDQGTWDRVQALLRHTHYQSHELLFAGELIRCGYCERAKVSRSLRNRVKSVDIPTTVAQKTIWEIIQRQDY